MDTAKRESPSSYRNEAPIREQLLRFIGSGEGDLLEVAAGTGQHSAAFSSTFTQLNWWPTDLDPENLASIEAWRAEDGGPNLQAAQTLDVTSEGWTSGGPIPPLPGTFRYIMCCNMVHISPWAATQGLFAGAERKLLKDGVLFIYGPYRRNGQHTSEGNASFDVSLRSRDPSWGIRDLEDMDALGQAHGFHLHEVVQMPANNLSLIFRPVSG